MNAFVFPGQGAQFTGMGHDAFKSSEKIKQLFKEADDILGFSLSKIMFHGSVSKDTLQSIIVKYHYSFVPLVTNIKGAFPSKIYELIINQVPVIYIGEGEAKDFILSNNLGYCLNPNNIDQLPILINDIYNNQSLNYREFTDNCKKISNQELNFKKQFLNFLNFLNE